MLGSVYAQDLPMGNTADTLVSGATGLVGSAVARKLVRAGLLVRALVRPGSPRFHLDGLDLEFAGGDIRDAQSVRRAMAGIRHVFHVAADYRLWARDPREIFAANVDGTRIVMREALSAGVERVVYTSSVATLALRADGSPADETVPLSEEEGIGAYKRSKIAAERLVEAMVANEALPAVIVNPSIPASIWSTSMTLPRGTWRRSNMARSANATFSAARTCFLPICWPTSPAW